MLFEKGNTAELTFHEWNTAGSIFLEWVLGASNPSHFGSTATKGSWKSNSSLWSFGWQIFDSLENWLKEFYEDKELRNSPTMTM